MKDDLSLLDIFRDPLLTLIALALLSTVWIILPTEEKETSASIDLGREKEKILEAIRVFEQLRRKNDRAEAQEDALRRELQLTDRQLKRRVSVRNKEKKAGDLRSLVDIRKKELRTLQDEVATRRKKTEEKTKVRAALAEIEDLKKKIIEIETRIKLIEESIQDLHTRVKQEEAEQEQDQRPLEDLTKQVQQKEAEHERIAGEIEEMRRLAQGAGFGEYSVSKAEGKEGLVFEAVSNRLVLMSDGDNYDVNVYRTVEQGRVISIGEVVKKETVDGESLDTIKSSESIFQTQLREHDSQNTVVIFRVRKDSFQVFREARAVANKNGFPVGWWPQEGPMYFSSSGRGRPIPVK